MRISQLACLVSLLLLSACSGDDTSTAAATGSSGGGSGPSTEPQGAFNVEIYATMAQTCPPGNVHIDIGNTKLVPPTVVVDGVDGATVSCKVAQMGESFAASGEIKAGTSHVSFADVLTDGGSATGTVTFDDPATATQYVSSTALPCVFQFAPGSGQEVSAGRIFVQFDCSDLVSAANPADTCSARYGYAYFENCDL
jgi:hypothetical protein